jgi:serine/threonine protein kinase
VACSARARVRASTRRRSRELFPSELAGTPAFAEHVTLTQALSELPGEGIARAYDAGIDPDRGLPYVVSERLVFPTLSRYVAERGPLSPQAVAQSLEVAAAALDAAHARGIVHGNLKPDNLFVSFDNPRWTRLTDFCVARLRASSGVGPSSLLGFSAPEAAAGFETQASDRYALGLLTFFALVGGPWHSAFRATDGLANSRSRIASERARALGGKLEPSLDPWFSRVLAADAEARYPSGQEMAHAFVELLFGGATLEGPAREPSPEMADTARPDGTRPYAPPQSLPTAGPAFASTLSMSRAGSSLASAPEGGEKGAATSTRKPTLPELAETLRAAGIPAPVRPSARLLLFAGGALVVLLVALGAWLLRG